MKVFKKNNYSKTNREINSNTTKKVILTELLSSIRFSIKVGHSFYTKLLLEKEIKKSN
tara:strand:+ start:806 stop:979 length:174 start_codon:yes stop_codon:yes gene_type:complete